MTLAAGSKLGPYEILAPLGAGGMGEVYRGKDPRLGREVAIKVLPASLSEDPDRLRRFEQEARAAGVLNHPNVTIVYDVGRSDEGAPYVVQELLHGQTLRDALAGDGFPPRKALDYAAQIARGLDAAHEKGIVHRDLKPENVFVTRDGRVKILDFGLAKLVEPEAQHDAASALPTASAGTEPGVVLGTLGYMSPEQVRGLSADARSDIFSLGAVLYEMLAGRRAFQGGSAADTMSAILKEDPPDLASTVPGVTPGLERVVRHCLAKSPEQRFRSAHDVTFALDAIDGASAPSAAPAPAEARSRRPAWLPIALAAALAGAVVFLAMRRPAIEPPVFRQLTFRRGLVGSARFTADGHTVVYSAAWEGRPPELYEARLGLPESQPLAIPGVEELAGISATGEMAVLMPAPPGQTLAKVALTGGTPREVAEDIGGGDISRDGQSLAIARWIGGGFRLEYPIGRTLLQTGGSLTALRISPDGERVAFFDHPSLGDDRGTLAFVDRSGKKTTLGRAWASTGGIAWTPSGREIWFSAAADGANLAVHAATLSGTTRRVLSAPGRLVLHDIARDGRLLLEERDLRQALMHRAADGGAERDLAWLDFSYASAIARDGSFLIFGETGEGGGGNGGVYLRRTDGSPAVRLGDGIPDSLSPDEKWVLTLQGPEAKLMRLPVGAGEASPLPDFGIRPRTAQYLPDGKRLLLAGTRGNEPIKLFVADLESRNLRELDPGALGAPSSLSPDGTRIFAVRSDNRAYLYPLEGGAPSEVTAYTAGDWPAGWSADGRSLYLVSTGSLPAKIWKVDLATGKRELWKEIAPTDASERGGLFNVVVSRDERSYAYNYSRSTSKLYIVEGLEIQ